MRRLASVAKGCRSHDLQGSRQPLQSVGHDDGGASSSGGLCDTRGSPWADLLVGAWGPSSRVGEVLVAPLGMLDMSKAYFFLKDIDTSHLGKTICPDVYCPPGGYEDKGMNRRFDSKGEKFRYLRQHGMREAELSNPDKSIGGTEGAMVKRRGNRGTFKASPMPAWMKEHLERQAHVG